MNARFISVSILVCLSALVLLGGCVPEQKYKEALAANNRAQVLLEEARGEAAAATEARRQTEVTLASTRSALGQKDKLLVRQRQALTDADRRHAKLQKLYNDLLAADPGPKPFGEIALPARLDEALQAWAKAHRDLVDYDRARGMVKFKTDLVFARGSDGVQVEAKETLVKLAEIIKADEAGEFHVYIAGHTDDMRIAKPETLRRHPTNWYLSVHRAVAVKDVLSEAGVAEQKLGVMGFGEFHPVAPNAPDGKGNPANRRVEIWIIPPARFLTASAAAQAAPETKD